MVLINFTNIVVDQFNYAKRSTYKYIYFLTHWHSDHYQGLTQNWNFGKIYCSKVTKLLLLTKFPKLNDTVIELQLDKQYEINLTNYNNLSVNVRLFDSNHIAGSVMILFQGYFGRVLHTGDLRFNQKMIKYNEYLFPNGHQSNINCSLKIDELILDNTYCDPIFKFPTRSKAMEYICEIINKNLNKRIFIATDTIGKQQVFVLLAKKYQTFIVVNQQRYQYIKCMNIDKEIFTTDQSLGWIQLIKKGMKSKKLLEHTKSISITLTGWANIDSYYTDDNRDYIVGYSLHSNFVQLQMLMKAIYPGSIKPIVNHGKKSQKINKIQKFSGYVNTLYHLNQRGLEFFEKQYIRPQKISNQFRQLLQNKQIRKKYEQILNTSQQQETNNSIQSTVKTDPKISQYVKGNKMAITEDPIQYKIVQQNKRRSKILQSRYSESELSN